MQIEMYKSIRSSDYRYELKYNLQGFPWKGRRDSLVSIVNLLDIYERTKKYFSKLWIGFRVLICKMKTFVHMCFIDSSNFCDLVVIWKSKLGVKISCIEYINCYEWYVLLIREKSGYTQTLYCGRYIWHVARTWVMCSKAIATYYDQF